MSLGPGVHVGPYEILSAIGAGGMVEVYRARDTRLDRDVAIKVLPDAFAADAERLARFEREAKILAALNHPNIAQIYGVEEANDARAIVMEFVRRGCCSTNAIRSAARAPLRHTTSVSMATVS
jgi:eukaryotic-like serine/threonine-protein kinase